MRNVNCVALSGLENANVNGSQLDTNQWVSASFHCYFADADGAGTIKIQASNDIALARNMTAIDGFVVSHWVDVPSASVVVAAGAAALITVPVCSYRWMRAVWTSTGGNSVAITVNVNALSV